MRLAGLLALTLFISACGDDPATPPSEVNSAQAFLTGTVSYRERMRLRLDAVIKVRLEDVSLQDAPAMVLSEQTIPAKGQSVPVPFALEYDPSRIDERYTYSVRAEIRSGQGELLWTTTTHHPVLTRGAPSGNVEIIVESVMKQ